MAKPDRQGGPSKPAADPAKAVVRAARTGQHISRGFKLGAVLFSLVGGAAGYGVYQWNTNAVVDPSANIQVSQTGENEPARLIPSDMPEQAPAKLLSSQESSGSPGWGNGNAGNGGANSAPWSGGNNSSNNSSTATQPTFNSGGFQPAAGNPFLRAPTANSATDTSQQNRSDSFSSGNNTVDDRFAARQNTGSAPLVNNFNNNAPLNTASNTNSLRSTNTQSNSSTPLKIEPKTITPAPYKAPTTTETAKANVDNKTANKNTTNRPYNPCCRVICNPCPSPCKPVEPGTRQNSQPRTNLTKVNVGPEPTLANANAPAGPREIPPPGLQRVGYAEQPTSRVSAFTDTSIFNATYLVQPDDSLWTIAAFVYGNGEYHRALAEHNRRFFNGRRIGPGDEISTPPESTLRRLYPWLCPAAE